MNSVTRTCVAGSANVDLTFRAPRFSRPGETLAGRALHQGMGGKGVLVFDESGALHLPAIRVIAVDTTGAGDAFSAALAVSLAEGMSFFESARRASAVAAISVTRIGTQTAFPTLSEVNHLSRSEENVCES